MEIFSLLGKIALDGQAAVENGLKQVDSKAEQLSGKLKQVGTAVTGAGKTMTTWVTGPIATAGTAIVALATKTGNYADRILDLSDITGMSTDSIQEWQHVARLAGVETEAVTRASEGLIRRLPQIAKEGCPASEAITALGVSIKDTSGNMRDADAIMDDLLYSLANMEDPLQRNALGSQLFGGAWKDIAPILAMGTDGIKEAREEAHRLGIVLGEDALNEANQFRQEMDRLKGVLAGAFNEIGSNLAPVLSDTLVPLIEDRVVPALREFGDRVGRLITWFAELDPKWQKVILAAIGFAAAIGPILLVLGPMITSVSTLIGFLPQLGAAFTALTGPIGLVIAAVAAAVAIGWYLYDNWDEVKELVTQLWEDFKEFWVDLWEGLKAWFSDLLNAINTFFVDTWEAVKNYFLEWWNNYWAFWSEAWTMLNDWFVELWETLKAWFFELITSIANYYIDQWNELYSRFQDILTALRDFFANTWGNIRQTGINIWEGFRDGVLDIWSGLVDGIKGFINLIIRAVNSMVERLNRISFSIPSWVPGIGGRSWGFNLPTIPELADGGIIRREGLALVGEAGPELLHLPRGAQVTPLPVGGTTTTNINITGNTFRNRSDIDYLVSELKRLKI